MQNIKYNTDIFRFGRYKGWSYRRINDFDPLYIDWCIRVGAISLEGNQMFEATSNGKSKFKKASKSKESKMYPVGCYLEKDNRKFIVKNCFRGVIQEGIYQLCNLSNGEIIYLDEAAIKFCKFYLVDVLILPVFSKTESDWRLRPSVVFNVDGREYYWTKDQVLMDCTKGATAAKVSGDLLLSKGVQVIR